MKLRYLFASFATAAALLFATGCAEETLGDLGVIKVDNTNVNIPETGGSAKIVITATQSWSIDESSIPDGVSIAPLSGGEGQTTVIISSESAAKDINGEIKILCGGKTQFIVLYQPGDPALKPQFDPFEGGDFWIMFNTGDKWLVAKPCTAEIGNGSSYAYIFCDEASGSYEDGTLSSTAANVYTFTKTSGGYHVSDSEGGYLWQSGSYNNFYRATAGGDYIWTVQQLTETTFQIESNTAHVLCYSSSYSNVAAYSSLGDNIRPYLVPAKDPAPEVLKVETTKFDVDKEGGVLTIPAYINADNVKVDYDASWLRYTGTDAEGFTFIVDANSDGGRSATVTVKASLGEYSGDAVITVYQKGGITGNGEGTLASPYDVEKAICIANNKIYTDDEVYVKGIISQITDVSTQYGNATYYISVDGKTDNQLQVFRGYYLDGAKFTEETKDAIQVGCEVVVLGKLNFSEKTNAPEISSGNKLVSVKAAAFGLSNSEILAMMDASDFTYSTFKIPSASGEWTVNAARNKDNKYLQVRGQKGSFIQTPVFDKDIKSVTINFSTEKNLYADNVYCAFPGNWTGYSVASGAYSEEGNVGKAVTDGSASITIPVANGNNQVVISLIGTYAYYVDSIDVEL